MTLVALYILSSLITNTTKKSNEDFAWRNFTQKYEIVQQEFSGILEQKKVVDYLLNKSNDINFINNIKTLNIIHLENPIIINNWFRTKKTTQTKDSLYINSSKNTPLLRENIETFLQQTNNKNHISKVFQYGDSIILRNYFETIYNRTVPIQYGYDINLNKLHSYFSNIDISATNYVYIFDHNGICLFHPDMDKIGKNIFDFTTIIPSDTIFNKDTHYKKSVALSEYLQVDVIRYMKPFKVNGPNWYICTNFPKMITDENVNNVKQYAYLIYLTTTFIILFIFYLFNRANRKEYLEKEALNREKIMMQLQQLKNQINPHFLFNSLNSLYMLIGTNNETAKKFTIHLSKIYRYLIDPPKKNLVQLSEELDFIKEYLFLQKTRFNEELLFSINITNTKGLYKKIPYLSLQIAVENAIKHNIATLESPLQIDIIINSDQVLIKNNLQIKTHKENSQNFGLKYLKSIYNFHSEKRFSTGIKEGNFICILPLIN